MSLLIKIVADLSQITPGDLPQPSADKTHLMAAKNLVLNIIGAMALLIIVVSGFRYILSAGDPQKTSRARNGVIYALVGLAIAIVANAIVTLVINKVSG
jgi:FtsH-binding integral membrane protein